MKTVAGRDPSRYAGGHRPATAGPALLSFQGLPNSSWPVVF